MMRARDGYVCASLCTGIVLAGCGLRQPFDGVSPDGVNSLARPITLSRVEGQSHVRPAYGVIYSFKGFPSDGSSPFANLANVNGTLYGTTFYGGTSDNGTVFAMTTSGESVLYNFEGGSDGTAPYAGLVNTGRTLYGTTSGGGSFSSGTVFAVAGGKESLLHSFTGGSGDGSTPTAPLLAVDGTLYGTTKSGGANDQGTVFAISSSGKESVLHSFGGNSTDGAIPLAGLIDFKGTFYGTTQNGGTYNKGTVFKISPSGTESVMYSFKGGSADGEYPYAGLLDVAGTLYGTTQNGGASNDGTVFKILSSGTERVLYSFAGKAGKYPLAGLIDIKGTLYGTTGYGGTHDDGTVFAFSSGKETVLHSFAGTPQDGANPLGSLLDVNGTLYGTTAFGGTASCPGEGCGTVFSLAP